jgi:hypothetical protein
MTTQSQAGAARSSPTRSARANSIDFWAVALALALSALVYLGVIKHVPW